MGLTACILIYASTILHCEVSLSCRLPDSIIFLCTLLYFVWIIFDNIDGKQARKTQSSTPLGLLYDHQTDALNVSIMSTFFGVLSLYGNSPYTLAIWTAAMMIEYFENWEALYVGAYNMSSNRCLLVGMLSLTIGILNPEYFSTTMLFQMELRVIMLYAYCGLAGIIVLFKYDLCRITNVFMKSNKKTDALMDITSFSYIVFCVIVVVVFSPSGLAYTGTREAILFLGFIFAREMGYYQIAHITNSEYEALNTTNFTLLSLFMFNTSCHAWGYNLIDEYNLLLVFTILSGLSYLHFICSTTKEIQKELNIPIFTNLRNFNVERKVQSI